MVVLDRALRFPNGYPLSISLSRAGLGLWFKYCRQIYRVYDGCICYLNIINVLCIISTKQNQWLAG